MCIKAVNRIINLSIYSMKKTTVITTAGNPEANGLPVENNTTTLDQRIRSLENERRILLELGNDITKVREKNDLIVIFSSKIRELFPFSHSIVTLIDYEAGI